MIIPLLSRELTVKYLSSTVDSIVAEEISKPTPELCRQYQTICIQKFNNI